MIKNVVLTPEAEQDITEAFTYYEENLIGLGSSFILCVDAAFQSISRNPEQYKKVYKNIRRVLIRKFPFGIFFIEEKERIVIIAVFHAKRNPKEWKSRTKN